MRQITASGQTLEEAVHSALKQLNITEDQAKVEIIDEGKKGIFGIFGSKPAVVKVMKEEDPVEKLQKYLKNIISEFDIEINIDMKVEQNVVTFQLLGERIALLIGKRGQTLNAIQYLAQLAIHRYADKYYTVIVDAEGYRDRRKETLIVLAERLADRAVRTNKPVKIEPMPSYERKIIHTALQRHKAIETDSQGSEPNRYVVIKPK
ncbi:RNA-binding protein Jag [Gracilibacillus boraciitolerans JCM 21714]|uniref:RNA-binding protein KhpB n=1 Tax=Gracilibacillus boraciitolerans JCM 21714 TaxID=1298598 RepID=W4VLY3_9BACI|nr:RNA-binding cell elongation regulator Jag/EloR [Gracilibacillus boraciitolerans]GAE93838.1 RNA-binding protein Jag [Gracilibacillus boraciitolerans JCM 21714]